MGLPRALRDVDSIQQAVQDASEAAKERGVPLTLERLAVTIGICRQDLSNVLNGHKGDIRGESITQDVVDALKKAVDICAMDIMEHGMSKGINPIMPIFALKANHGYNDHPEQQSGPAVVIVTGADKLQD